MGQSAGVAAQRRAHASPGRHASSPPCVGEWTPRRLRRGPLAPWTLRLTLGPMRRTHTRLHGLATGPAGHGPCRARMQQASWPRHVLWPAAASSAS
jgi:hypothetical protein